MGAQPTPDEIWALVFSFFEPTVVESPWEPWGYNVHPYLQPDLHPLQPIVSLCLVSRQFCRIAQPLLYRMVNAQHFRNGQAFCFLRTLLTAPHLAQMVRVLSIRDCVYPSPGTKSLLAAALSHVQIPPRFRICLEHTLKDDLRGWSGGVGTLALSLTPNVQRVYVDMGRRSASLAWLLSGSLQMEDDFSYEVSDVEYDEDLGVDDVDDEELSFPSVSVAEAPTAQEIESLGLEAYANYGLQQMREAWLLAAASDREATSMAYFEAVLLHPNLEILHLVKIDWRRDEVEKMRWSDRMSDLHTLDIRDCLVDSAGLLNILSRCPKLRRLSIDLGDSDLEGFYGYDEDDVGWNFEMEEFGRVLRSRGKNLTELRFKSIEYRCDHRFEERYIQEAVMGSLKDLTSLRVLDIHELDLVLPIDNNTSFTPPPPLGLNSVLPENLEVLYFPYNDFGAFHEICDLIESGCYSKLRKIRLGGYNGIPHQSPQDKMIPGWQYSFESDRAGETYSWPGKRYTFIEFLKSE